jgi:hypothetical protein
VDADGGQRLAHLVKLERFDDRDDELHGQAFIFLRFRRIPDVRVAFCAHPNLASFRANGTKNLQG